jgi:hypothetical protein
MTSDDVTAVAAISLGAVASVAATMLLLAPDPDVPRNMPFERIEVVRITPSIPIVDYAIIRSEPKIEIMVGPEGATTGWVPDRSIAWPDRSIAWPERSIAWPERSIEIRKLRVR